MAFSLPDVILKMPTRGTNTIMYARIACKPGKVRVVRLWGTLVCPIVH